jgi:hypothetical protein
MRLLIWMNLLRSSEGKGVLSFESNNQKDMNQLFRISKILNVEPFKITALWNNGEIRTNDFTKAFEQWKATENTHLLGLTAWEIFKNVSVPTNRPALWNG